LLRGVRPAERTAFVGVQLVPRAGWRQDEDGEPVPTFNADWVKITD
jgi:hypothetical protein